MIIIGEKINGFIPKTLTAIETRDEDYLRELARVQEECAADYLDICAGVSTEIELETMQWLIGLAEEASPLPLCLDSSSPAILLECLPLVSKPGILNSVSLEVDDEGRTKCDVVFPVIADTAWKVVALTIDTKGISDDPQVKAEIAGRIITTAAEAGIAQDRIFIDPVVTTLATNQESLVSFNETIRLIKAEFPEVHFTSGLSNISFGMPFRKAINMQFLALAMAAGMDSAIMDPTSRDMQATIHAVDALLGNDEYCMEYLSAYREGLFGNAPI
jgi:5-methyltetrahydrofolate--homocysteine methyltransferase